MLKDKVIKHAPKYFPYFKDIVESLEVVGGKAGTLGVTLMYKFKDFNYELEYNYFDSKEWKIYNVVENIIDAVSEIADISHLNYIIENIVDDNELDRYGSHSEFMLATSMGRIIVEEFPNSPEVQLVLQVAEKLENFISPEDQQKLVEEFYANTVRNDIMNKVRYIVNNLEASKWSKEELFQVFEVELIKRTHEE